MTEKKGKWILKWSSGLAKVAGVLTMVMGLFMYNGFYCYATNFGENIGTWALDQLFWFGLIIVAAAFIGCLVKKNYAGAVVTFIVGGIVLFFVKSPQTVYEVGSKLANIFISG